MTTVRARGFSRRAAAAVSALLLAACASTPGPCPEPASPGQDKGRVVARSERLLVYLPGAGDTLAELAERYLGSADKAWQIGELNGDIRQPLPGRPMVLPLEMPNPLGVTAEGARAVTVLSYHRVASGNSKMTIAPERLQAQLEWLAASGWHVVRLGELAAFLAGRQPLPQRAVVITFDDGYESVYRNAFPLLRRLGMPATMFVYTDFIGARDAVSWAQMDEMLRSGLIDIQAHSKSHANLAERAPGESDAAYRARVETELRVPRQLIERMLASRAHPVRYLAYPYGDANDKVLEAMQRSGYELGLTVTPGTNPFYAAPLLLKRQMIFGDTELDEFKARLQGRRLAGRP
ncbi:hypothetical protein CLD22_14585 [Rubrivivax gelatinosus]|nr:hypothetical protein [Rubrivivax gelatinosus]